MAEELSDADVLGNDQPPQELSDDDVLGPGSNAATAPNSQNEDEIPQPSALGAALRGAARSAIPTIGGLAAGALGGAAGVSLGPVGVVAGGVAAGMATGAALSATEDALVQELGLDKIDSAWNPWSPAYQQADQQHPWATWAGENAPALAVLRPGIGTVTALQRVGSGAIAAGVEGGRQLYTGQFNPADIATQFAMGAALPNVAAPIENAAARVGASMRGQRVTQNDTGEQTGRPNQELQPEEADDKDTITDANDLTSVAGGVAEQNAPAPDHPDHTGNPVGAPMEAREAAAPSDPERNYAKSQPERAGINMDAQHPDVVAALTASQEGAAPDAQPQAPQAQTPVPAPAAAPAGAVAQPMAPGGAAPDNAAPVPPASGARPNLVPNSIDPVELSRWTREAVDNARTKQAAGQLGEAFQGETPPGSLDPDRPAAPVQPDTVQIGGLKFADLPPHVAQHMAPLINDIQDARVDSRFHVPYTGGSSVDGDTVFRDKSIPRIALLPNGQQFRTDTPLQIHEVLEKGIMMKLIGGGMDPATAYKVGHWAFAEPAEDAWYRAQGIDPAVAEKWWDQRTPHIQREPIKNTPSDLYQEPYPHDSVGNSHEGGVATQKPSSEELAAAQRILENPVTPDVTAPVREPITEPPAKQSPTVEAAIKALQQREGGDEVVSRMRKLPPEQQEIIARRALQRLSSNQTSSLPAITRARPVMDSGLQARSPKDLTRKQNAIKAWKDAYETYGPAAGPLSDADTVQRARAAVEAAKSSNNGIDPLSAYMPRQKPDEYKWLKAARAVANNPTAKNINEFQAAHALGGETGQAVDEEISRKVRPTVEQAELGQNISQDTGQEARPEFEMLEPWKDRQGKVAADQSFVEGSNAVRKWLNGLSDEDYDALQAQYEHPLRTEVEETSDPAALHEELAQELAKSTKQRPPNMEPVPAEEAPPAQVKQIKSRADLAPTEPGAAASSVRKLSPEAYAVASKAALEKANAKSTPFDRLVSEENAAKNPENLQEVVPGTWNAMREKVKEFGLDTAGSSSPAGKLISTLLKPNTTENTGAKETAESLGEGFYRHILGMDNDKSQVRAALLSAPKLLKSEWRRIYRAMENKTIDQLPQKERDAYDQTVVGLRNSRRRALNDLIELKKNNPAILRQLDLPADADDAGIDKSYVPLLTEGKQLYDEAPSANPFNNEGRNLSLRAGALEKRGYGVLRDAAGNRFVFSPGDDKITIYQKGRVRTIKTPSIDLLKTGGVKINGTDYKVDYATSDEIMSNVLKAEKDPNDPTGRGRMAPAITYSQNPVMSEGQAFLGTKAVLRNARMLVDISTDKRFLANSTTDRDVAKKLGWIQTELPAFQERDGKDLYMPANIAYAMNDFNKMGFGPNVGLDVIRNAGQGLMKTLYALSPLIHPLNELNLWTVARGFDWMSKEGGRSLYKNGWRAMRDVYTQNLDAIREAREAGLNLILPTVLNRDIVRQTGETFGYQAPKEPSLWDPITKSLGVNIPETAKWISKNSEILMFGLSDMLALQRYYELQDLHGMSRDAAAVETHKFVSSYRLPTTIGGSRVLQQVLADPAFSLFGPYHGGMWMTYGHLFKTLLGSAATQQQRTRAFGQLLVGAAITGIVGPLLDEAYKKATGNDGASISPRGFSTIPRKMYDVATGNNVSGALANIFTPALPLDAATEIMHNTDAFTGKPIVQPMDMSRPKNILKGAVQGGEFLARKLVPPIGTAESAARQGLTPGQAIGRVAEEQFGGHTPSSPENKYKAHQPVYNQRDEKKRGKNPPGVIEGLLGR